MIYLDTHVVVWLYAGETGRLSPIATELIEGNGLLISPIVQLELEYLREVERINTGSALILESLAQSIGLQICDRPFARVVVESVQQCWTRDPFDRLIVAQATTRNAVLLTKDRSILANYPHATW